MTEDKADKALRKVIINLIPQRLYGGPALEEDYLRIDISDKLPQDEFFCLDSIGVGDNDHAMKIKYVPFEDHAQFKCAIENILDATIVNAKQRESIQKLVDNAFYSCTKFEAGL